MSQGQSSKKSGGAKKIGRSKEGCRKYSLGDRRDKNKVKKVKKMLKETKQFSKLEKVKNEKTFEGLNKKINL